MIFFFEEFLIINPQTLISFIRLCRQVPIDTLPISNKSFHMSLVQLETKNDSVRIPRLVLTKLKTGKINNKNTAIDVVIITFIKLEIQIIYFDKDN